MLKIFSEQERNTLTYPSVTVCKKYTFNHYIDDIFLNKSLALERVVEAANKQPWDVEELFHFFSQPNRAVWSTLIGRDPTRLGSHWSRAS